MTESSIAELPSRSRARQFVGRASRSLNVVVGALLLFSMIMLTVLAPLLSVYDPIEQFRRQTLLPPSWEHPFGTDNVGRDIFSRVLYGGRVSLQVGVFSVAFASVTGTLLGLLSGYYGRWLDNVVMRFIDVLLAFPSILMSLVIIAVLGKDLRNVMLAVGIATLPIYTRVVRGSVLSIKEVDYVEAARAIGASTWRIMFTHILPNILAPIIVVTTNGMAGAIIAGAALSFLGLGEQPPNPEWGLMLAQGRDYIRAAWWITTFPGLAIMITVLSINLLGDGLRDILDPRLKI